MAIHDLGNIGPGALPNMNRAQARRVEHFARAGRPAAKRAMAGCRTAACAGPSLGVLDRPTGNDGMRRGRSLTSAVGQVLSLPALAEVSPDDGPSLAMTRATNMAGVITILLAKTPPLARKGELAEIGGIPWADSVLKLANTYPGGSGLTDAVRFALSMHFLIGILDSERNAATFYSNAYLTAVAKFKASGGGVTGPAEELATKLEEKQVAKAAAEGLNGLGAINRDRVQAPASCVDRYSWIYTVDRKIEGVKHDFQAENKRAPTDDEITYYGSMKWCTTGQYHDNPNTNMRRVMREIRDAKQGYMPGPNTFPGGPTKFDESFADRSWWSDTVTSVKEGLDQAGDWLASTVCKGFKTILGDTVGGFLCTVITKGIELIKNFIKTAVIIITKVVKGLVEFVKAIVKLDLLGAAKAIIVNVTSIIFIIPPIGPLFATFLKIPLDEDDRKKMGPGAPKSLVLLGEEVAERSPFFLLSLVFAIIAVVTGPSLVSIGALIIALAPAIAVLLAGTLRPKITALQKYAEKAIADAIEKFIKLATIIVQGIIALKDLISTLKEKLDKYFAKQGGAIATVQAGAGNVLKKFLEKWGNFWNALTSPFKGKATAEKDPNKPSKTLNLSDVSAAASALLSTVPEILAAFVGEDEDMKQAMAAGKGAFDQGLETYKEAQSVIDTGQTRGEAKDQAEFLKQTGLDLRRGGAAAPGAPAAATKPGAPATAAAATGQTPSAIAAALTPAVVKQLPEREQARLIAALLNENAAKNQLLNAREKQALLDYASNYAALAARDGVAGLRGLPVS